MTLCTNTPEELQQTLRTLAAVCERWGLRLNPSKTKIMRAGPNADPSISLSDADKPLQVVSSFKYLGSWFCSDGAVKKEVTARISAAYGALDRLAPIWRSKCYSRNAKVVLYKTLVLTILLYGAESWPISEAQTERLEVFHRSALRRVLKIRRRGTNQISNDDLLQRANIPSIADTLRLRRMDWLGNITRMAADRTPRRLLFGFLADGCRPRRTPPLTLRRLYEKDITFLNGEAGTTGIRWQDRARDKKHWYFWIRGETTAPPAAVTSPTAAAAIAAAAEHHDAAGPSHHHGTRTAARSGLTPLPLAPPLTRVNRPGGGRPPSLFPAE